MTLARNYYNEFDPFAAAWLQELIKAKLIPDGDVDERSITEVRPEDLTGYTQCHFFAGIGGWSLALQLAGWPTDRPVWTGSCPCQPFSSAGKQKGKADERHLWPVWFSLIRQSRPESVFGEQVSSAIRHHWWDDVADDLERENYTTRAEIRPACSVGAPHKRDRLWFVADAAVNGWRQRNENARRRGDGICAEQGAVFSDNGGSTLGQPDSARSQPRKQTTEAARYGSASIAASGDVADTERCGSPRSRELGQSMYSTPRQVGETGRLDDDRAGHWQDGVWIDCPDGKQRLVKPSIRLLAHGVPNRVGKLRGYGNDIVPQVAAEFIKASM